LIVVLEKIDFPLAKDIRILIAQDFPAFLFGMPELNALVPANAIQILEKVTLSRFDFLPLQGNALTLGLILRLA
jgi:hypothetical protein